jgi:hypothetical protein
VVAIHVPRIHPCGRFWTLATEVKPTGIGLSGSKIQIIVIAFHGE